jgi:hypothetical protein
MSLCFNSRWNRKEWRYYNGKVVSDPYVSPRFSQNKHIARNNLGLFVTDINNTFEERYGMLMFLLSFFKLLCLCPVNIQGMFALYFVPLCTRQMCTIKCDVLTCRLTGIGVIIKQWYLRNLLCIKNIAPHFTRGEWGRTQGTHVWGVSLEAQV